MRLGRRIALKLVRTKFKLLTRISKRKAAEEAFKLFTTPQTRNNKVPAAVFRKAETLTLVFKGIKTYGYRWNKGAERKVLIAHGFESSIVNFDRYIHPLIRLGYEVIGFDAPAHGRSGGKQIHAIDYKDFLLQVMQAYGPVKNFITHSFGGLALGLLLEELPHDETYHAVFIAPATESTTAMNQFFQLLQLSDDLRLEFDQLITEANNKPPSWYSVARAADHIKARVLFLQDKEDVQTPFADVAPIVNKKLPNFRFVITEGLGHSRIYSDSQVIKTILEFLK